MPQQGSSDKLPKQCVVCGVEIVSKYNNRKYCSSKCNMRYWRKVRAAPTGNIVRDQKTKEPNQQSLRKLSKTTQERLSKRSDAIVRKPREQL